MSTIFVKHALFWEHEGKTKASWGLCWDGSTDAERVAHIQWCLKNKLNTVLINLNNEGYCSVFKPGKFGLENEWDMARANLVVSFLRQCKAAGLMTAVAHFDGPAIPNGTYHPIIDCSDDRLVYYLITACKYLYELVDFWLVGCESNRYGWSTEKVGQAIIAIQQSAPLRYVGSHEQGVAWREKADGQMGWVMTRSIPASATMWIHETSNHPANGDSRSTADMVSEIKFLVANAHGVPVGVAEHNLRGKKMLEQANAMAAVDGVYWMNY